MGVFMVLYLGVSIAIIVLVNKVIHDANADLPDYNCYTSGTTLQMICYGLMIIATFVVGGVFIKGIVH